MARIVQFTKDSSQITAFHEKMQILNLEQQCIENLRVQFVLFKEVVDVSGTFIASVQNDPALLHVASQCRKDIFSILLDAEASMSLINGFLIWTGHGAAAQSTISYVG